MKSVNTYLSRPHIFAGCLECDGGGSARAAWTGYGEDQVKRGLTEARQHAKKTGHETWADVTRGRRYVTE